MTPLVKAHTPQSEMDIVVKSVMERWLSGDSLIHQSFPGPTVNEARAQVHEWQQKELEETQMWMNDVYQVAVREHGDIVHLSIKRNDRETIHDWRDLQQIKNQLVGKECEGVELYPAESRLLDTANQYHLWVIKDTSFRFPFGFAVRCVSDVPLGKSVNRNFNNQK